MAKFLDLLADKANQTLRYLPISFDKQVDFKMIHRLVKTVEKKSLLKSSENKTDLSNATTFVTFYFPFYADLTEFYRPVRMKNV